MSESTFSIIVPSFKLDQVKEDVAKINRKSIKLNSGGLQYSIGETFLRSVTLDNGHKIKVEFNEVTFIGELPNLAGWTIVAVIDHSDGIAIVHSYSTIPDSYRDRGSYCDHCASMRRRNKTIILQKDNEFKQVGSTCLKDFLAIDPSIALSYLQSINTLIDSYSDPDFVGGFGYNQAVFSINEVIATAIKVIDHFGFTSTSAEDYQSGKFSTKTRMIEVLLPANKNVAEYYQSILPEFDDMNTRIESILTWLNNNNDNSEFILNLKAIVTIAEIKMKHFGYIAGLVSAYNKATMTKKEIEYADSYIGNIKDRINIHVKLISVKKAEGYYGITFIHTFTDQENHNIVWFGSKHCGYDINMSFTMKATIKDHKEYNGIKQTVITRPTF